MIVVEQIADYKSNRTKKCTEHEAAVRRQAALANHQKPADQAEGGETVEYRVDGRQVRNLHRVPHWLQVVKRLIPSYLF